MLIEGYKLQYLGHFRISLETEESFDSVAGVLEGVTYLARVLWLDEISESFGSKTNHIT